MIYYLLFLILIILFFQAQTKITNQSLRKHFDQYLTKTKDDWNYILPSELHEIYHSQKLDNYFLLDVRKPTDFQRGHIPGSTNIFWLDLLKEENLAKLPQNQEIILICYVGHTASQILVMLKLLGYRVRVLKFGYGESPDPSVPVQGWKIRGYELTHLKLF